jgi:hypothetical protein
MKEMIAGCALLASGTILVIQGHEFGVLLILCAFWAFMG